MRRNRFFIIGLILLFGGCSLAPKYNRSEAPVPAAWPTGPAYKESQALSGAPTAAEIPWREFIVADRLQKTIETALKNNRDLRIAALNVTKARAVYGIQRAEILPSLDAVGGGGKERVPGDLSSTGKATTAEEYHANLAVSSWEIDFFGRIRSLKDRALEAFLATEQAQRSTQILIVAEVASAYLTMAADRENLDLAQKTFETQKSAFHLIKRRYEAGLASALDLNRAQMQIDIARRDIARYTQQVARDQNALNLLVGTLPLMENKTFQANLSSVEPLKEISPGISSEVLLLRPDVMAAEHRLKAAHANIGAARAALFPRISLTTSVGTASSELSDLFGAGSETWSFAPQIVMPIFDGRLWSALDATKAEKEIAVAQYERAIQTAFKEVADALAVRGTVDEQLSAQQSLVNAAAETFRLSDLRYTKGIDSYLGVLDGQRSLYAARQGLVAIRLAMLANLVRLYAALGGGAEENPVDVE
jgi:outer membrane protein, multidrug efflux system